MKERIKVLPTREPGWLREERLLYTMSMMTYRLASTPQYPEIPIPLNQGIWLKP